VKRSLLALIFALAAVPAAIFSLHAVAPAKTEHFLVAHSEAFLAFYCAGSIAANGENPYRIQPLMACEHRAGSIVPDGVVEPAPLPGYALAFFSLFRTLPYATAAMVWAAILLMTLIVATWALARSTGLPWYLIAAALAPNAAFVSVGYGEIPPLCIGALSLSAYLLARKRYTLAALAASVVMLEPHVGLAACLSLFWFVPRARPALVFAGLLFAVAGVATLGWDGNVEFLQTALPSHARSEIVAVDQYSLTWILYALGVPAREALRGGSLSYAVMLAAGLYFARRLATSMRSDELLVLIPAAAVLIGGVFIHDIQMVIALPAALLVASRSSAWRRSLAYIAVALVAIPWGVLGSQRTLAFLSIAVFAVLAIDGRFGQPFWKRAAALAAGAFAVLFIASASPSPGLPLQPPAVRAPDAQASENWQEYIEREAAMAPTTRRSVLRKVLVWTGFATLALAAGASQGAALGENAAESAVLRRSAEPDGA
jgi:hypothetical protein